jgi:glycosyltransferase involved in cell wall biosynthesis
MGAPRFGILTSTHNRAEDYLPFCVESVQNQKLEDPLGNQITYRHIIVDDGSTDGTRQYLADVAAQDSRILHVPLERNVGLSNALCLGHTALIKELDNLSMQGTPVAETLPHYMLLVDDDDGLTPNALQLYAKACYDRWLQRKRPPAMMFGPATIIDEYGNELPDVPHIPRFNNIPDTDDRWQFFQRMQEDNHIPSKPAISYFLYDDYFSDAGYRCFDWAIARSALSHMALDDELEYVAIDEPTSYYRVHPSQNSLQGSTDGTWQEEAQRMAADPLLNPLSPKFPVDFRLLVDAINSLPVRKVPKS